MKLNNIEQIKENIRKFNLDSNVIKLKNYFSTLTFMEILGKERDELAHSSFISWLFNENKNMGIGMTAFKLFLDLVNEKAVIDEAKTLTLDYAVNISYLKKEYRIENNQSIDIYIEFQIDNEKYVLIIENKVTHIEDCKDKQYQTDRYFDYFSKLKDKTKKIYVYLRVDENKKSHNSEFINITYQNLLENVIEPLLENGNIEKKCQNYLHEYIRALMKPSEAYENSELSGAKQQVVMAKSKVVSDLVTEISKNNKELFDILKEYAQNRNEKNNELLDKFYETNKEIVLSVDPNLGKKVKAKKTTFEILNIPIGSKIYFTKTIWSENKIDESFDITTTNNDTGVNCDGKDFDNITQLRDYLYEKIGKIPTGNPVGSFIYKFEDGHTKNLRTIKQNYDLKNN